MFQAFIQLYRNAALVCLDFFTEKTNVTHV
jgi:hypothetical protein